MAPVPPENHVALDMYEAATRSRGTPRNYLGMSQIGEPCARKLWLSFRGYSELPLEGRAAMIFDLGSRVEDAVIHWIRTAGYKVEGQQADFSAHNGLFRGHCDGIIHGVTHRPHILEIKSANAKKFKAFRENGVKAVSPTYYAQVQCYMGYSGLERALWVVMNKDTCELYTERCYFNKEDFDQMDFLAWNIICANDIPNPTDNYCGWCGWRFWCKQPELAVQNRKTCGTCRHLRAGTPQPICQHGGIERTIKTWGIACEDWELQNPLLDTVPF